MIENLLFAMREAIAVLKKHPAREVVLVHHNDTDGLSSGAILESAFQEAGYGTNRFSLEKPYPQVLEILLDQPGQVIIFADFAGRIAPLISEMNRKRNLVLILDHHPAEAVDDETVLNLDGALFGLRGDRDISASATCYLFAQELLDGIGGSAKPLAHLGALGAVGDGFYVNGALSGVNREVMKTAVEQNLMGMKPTPEGEDYTFFLGGTEYPARVICEALDTVGGVGYYSDGAARGVQICRYGLDEANETYIKGLIKQKDLIFSRETERLKKEIKTTSHLQWFDVEDRFQPMGIKMIGVFCNNIKDSGFLDETKYLAGFQHVPDTVPGFGDIAFNATKISMRVSEYLTGKIRAGEIPGLDSFLPEATSHLGGFSDACHGLSAATTVRIGEEELLVKEIEIVLNNKEKMQ